MSIILRGLARDVRQGWMSFGSSCLLIALATSLFVAFFSAQRNLARSCELTYQRLRFLDFTVPVRDLPASAIRRIAALPGIEAAMARRSIGGEIFFRGEAFSAQASSLPTDGRPAVNDLEILEGRYIAAKRGEVLLDHRFARFHGLAVGDTVVLRAWSSQLRIKIVGLVVSPEFLFLARDRYEPLPSPHRFAVTFLSQADVESLAGPGNNEVHVRTRDADCDWLMREVEKKLAEYLVGPAIPRAQQASHALLMRDRRAFAVVGVLLPSVLFGLAVLMLFFTIWRLISRQRRQLGMLMAQGFTRRRLARGYLLLSGTLAASGGLVGLLVGVLLGQQCTRFYANQLGIPFVETWIPWGHGLFALLVVVSSALLSTQIAANQVLLLDPVQALRADFAPRVVTAFQGSGIRPRWLLPVRNFLRQPGRSLLSVLGITVSVAQLVMVLSLGDSQSQMLDFVFRQVFRYDLEANLRYSASPHELPPFERWPGVERVEFHLRQKVALRSRSQQTDTWLWGVPGDTQLLGLKDRAGSEIRALDFNTLTMSPTMLSRLSCTLGEQVKVHLDSAPESTGQTFQVGSELDSPLASPTTLLLSRLQKLVASTYSWAAPDGVNLVLLKVNSAQLESVRLRLQAQSVVFEVSSPADRRAEIEDLLRMLNAYRMLMLLFTAIFAVIVLVSTNILNVAERSREFATLTCLGFHPRTLASFVLLENLLIWSIGFVLGTPVGLFLGKWLVNSYQSDLVRLEPTLSLSNIFLSALFSFAVCLGALWFTLLRLRRLPLTAANQERFD